MRRLMLVLTTCALAEPFGTMLVQGHANTLLTLRNIVLHSSQPVPFLPRGFLISQEMQKSSSEIVANQLAKSKTKSMKFIGKGRARRHIGNVVIESGQCDHVDLMDCSDFETDEMTCMLTATGMTCCVCTGMLRAAKRSLF